jgi:hypothetical protein
VPLWAFKKKIQNNTEREPGGAEVPRIQCAAENLMGSPVPTPPASNYCVQIFSLVLVSHCTDALIHPRMDPHPRLAHDTPTHLRLGLVAEVAPYWDVVVSH